MSRSKSIQRGEYPNHIEVWCEKKMIARHDRVFDHGKESLKLEHYLPILAQKGRAIRYARPVQYRLIMGRKIHESDKEF
ncbi:MAG: hypothetical protein IKF90_01430 [Parasporobacterium sp.]|nr:hypothetical protein [Parasporobacterium sp.]